MMLVGGMVGVLVEDIPVGMHRQPSPKVNSMIATTRSDFVRFFGSHPLFSPLTMVRSGKSPAGAGLYDRRTYRLNQRPEKCKRIFFLYLTHVPCGNKWKKLHNE